MVSFKEFIVEVHAAQGAIYEKQIQAKLSRAGLAPANLQTAGAGHGADAQMYTKSGKPYGVEVKLSPNVFAGQKNIRYNVKTGSWSWPKKQDDLTMFYDEIGLIDNIVLPHVQSEVSAKLKMFNTWFKKNKINYTATEFPLTLTNLQYTLFKRDNPSYKPELGTFDSSVDAIFANYTAKKVFYVQVGTSAGGFYYLEKDPLGLAKYGVPQFNPDVVQVRTRLKWGGSTLDSKELRSPKAKLTSTVSFNTGLIISGLVPSPVSIDRDLTFLKKGLGYTK